MTDHELVVLYDGTAAGLRYTSSSMVKNGGHSVVEAEVQFEFDLYLLSYYNAFT